MLNRGVINLIVVLLVLSEITYFISTHCPDVESELISRLLPVHRYVAQLGIVLVILSLTPVVCTLVVWTYRRVG